jgi:hypothetical protein
LHCHANTGTESQVKSQVELQVITQVDMSPKKGFIDIIIVINR